MESNRKKMGGQKHLFFANFRVAEKLIFVQKKTKDGSFKNIPVRNLATNSKLFAG